MTTDQKIILIVRFLTLADEYALKRQLDGEDIQFIKVIVNKNPETDHEDEILHIISDKDYYAIEPLIKEFIDLEAIEVEEL